MINDFFVQVALWPTENMRVLTTQTMALSVYVQLFPGFIPKGASKNQQKPMTLHIMPPF